MSDSISACRDEEEDYVDRCKRYGEEVVYRDGCPCWTGVHASILKERARNEAKAHAEAEAASPSRVEAEAASPSCVEERLRRERDAYKKAKEENDDRFMGERDRARTERDEALRACKAVSAERDRWRAKAEETTRLLDKGLRERDDVIGQRDVALKQHDRAIAERDKAIHELAAARLGRAEDRKLFDDMVEQRNALTKQRDIAIEQQGQIVNQRDGSIKEANRLLQELKESRADLAGQKEYTNEILMKASRITGERDEARRSLAAMHQDWMRVALAANKFQTQEEPDELLQRLAKEHDESDKRAKEAAKEKARGGFADGYKKAVEDVCAYLLQEHAFHCDKAKKTDCCEEMKRYSNRAEVIAYLRNEISIMRA